MLEIRCPHPYKPLRIVEKNDEPANSVPLLREHCCEACFNNWLLGHGYVESSIPDLFYKDGYCGDLPHEVVVNRI